MRLSVFTFPVQPGIGVGALARAVEERGFDGLWLPEHTHVPKHTTSPYPPDPTRPIPGWYATTTDLVVGLTEAVLATSTLRVGSAICLVNQRDPIITAKQIASIDQLAPGRLAFGVGPGWNREEMANHGVAFETRFGMMRERVEAIRAIWREEEAQYHGRYVDFDPIRCGPRPATPGGPPILVSGEAEGATRRALRYADGWLPRDNELRGDAMLARIADFRQRARAGGRPDAETVVFAARRDPAELCRYADAGVDEVLLPARSGAAGRVLADLDELRALAGSTRG